MESFKLSTPKKELYKRIEKFQQALKRKEVGAALISYKTDLFYFSGTVQQGWLYIPAEGAPLLMVFKDFYRAKQESGLDSVIFLKGLKYIPETLKEWGYKILSHQNWFIGNGAVTKATADEFEQFLEWHVKEHVLMQQK